MYSNLFDDFDLDIQKVASDPGLIESNNNRNPTGDACTTTSAGVACPPPPVTSAFCQSQPNSCNPAGCMFRA